MALPLPESVRARLADEIARLRDVARHVAWVAPENLHVTLKFLGHVEQERLTRVAAAVERVAATARPFDLTVRGLGAFPSLARARVVWAGIAAGAGGPAALAERIDAALSPLGFEVEDRPFTAHVTLGRVREPRRDERLAAAITAAQGREFGTFSVDCVELMRSDLSPRGARYTALASWPLGRTAPSASRSLQGETGS